MDNQQLRLFDEAINKDIGAAMAQRGAQWSGSMDNNRIENLVRPWEGKMGCSAAASLRATVLLT